MSELKTLIERGVGGVTPLPAAFERMLRRREQKRRNQRIAAGVVGLAVFVATIWMLTSEVPPDRGLTPAVTGPKVTGPVVWPDYPGRVGLVGLAPEELPPSTPARGDLVVSFSFGHTGGDPGGYHLHLYADGRLLREKLGEGYAGGETSPTGMVEQRLTPEGVELIRSEVLSTGLFDEGRHLGYGTGLHYGRIQVRDGARLVTVSWGDIGLSEPDAAPTPEQVDALLQLDRRLEDLTWLPPSAWEDGEIRPFVPSRYSLCLETVDARPDLAQVMASLPGPAEDLIASLHLSFREDTYAEGRTWCSAVTSDRARSLAAILEEEGARTSQKDVWGVIYTVGLDDGPLVFSIGFAPLLPDAP